MRTLLIRADAGEKIGTGHVMRCLALAQAWQDAGGEVTFAVTAGAEALVPRLCSESIEVAMLSCTSGSSEDARATLTLASEKAVAWLVVDGYCFGADYQKCIKGANLSLLMIDDNGNADHYYADLVLNQNLAACDAMYANRERSTRLLLGPRYALLRREFRSWRSWNRDIPERATRLLVTMGGADPENVTSKVLSAVAELELRELETKVVLGPLHKNREMQPHRGTTLLADKASMAELMAWADAAVAGAGSTSWELCWMGLPSLLIVLAENQNQVAAALEKEGAARSLGDRKGLSSRRIAGELKQMLMGKQLRADMGTRARSLVDGNGAARVEREMRLSSLRLRRARPEDCRMFWEWANDPSVRASSFSTLQIPWEQHLVWFHNKLNDQNCFMYVACEGWTPVGQIRFDLKGEEAVVHVSLISDRRGLGYGQLLVRRGVEALSSIADVRRVVAHIKPDNSRSRRTFERAGFQRLDSPELPLQGLYFVKSCQSKKYE